MRLSKNLFDYLNTSCPNDLSFELFFIVNVEDEVFLSKPVKLIAELPLISSVLLYFLISYFFDLETNHVPIDDIKTFLFRANDLTFHSEFS
jgi:hypothetical protein